MQEIAEGNAGGNFYIEPHPEQCLASMQEIAEENAHGKNGQLQRQQSAVQKATRVLLNRHTAPASLVLTYLPWLISASPKHALSVLKVSCMRYLDSCAQRCM